MGESTDRLERLERRVRRLGGLTAMLGCGWLVLLVWTFSPRPRLDAREFAVRDSAGVRRAALMVREDGVPVLRLDDVRGRPRFYAYLLPDGQPSLLLSDSAWVHRAALGLDESSRPYFALTDSAGHWRAIVSVDSAGRGRVDTPPVHAAPAR